MLKRTMNIAVMAGLLLGVGAVSFGQADGGGKERVDQLIGVIKSADASREAKAGACRQLSYLGGKEAIAPLAAMLASEEMNHMARYALEPIPDAAVDEAFRDALGKLKGRPLVGVIGSVGVRQDAKAIGALAAFLKDGDAEVAEAAARALGKIGTADAAKAILAEVSAVAAGRQVAFCEGLFRCAESLGSKGQGEAATNIYEGVRKLNSSHHQIRAGAFRGAVLARSVGRAAVLMEGVRSDDYVLVAAAARTAVEMKDAEVTVALAADLAKLSTDKQVLFIQVMGKRADAGALPAIFAAARSGAKAIRVAAIKAMPEIGDVSALAVLLDLMKDSDGEISQLAQNGVASLPGKEADAAVVAMLNSENTDVRLIGLEFIGRRRMVGCVPALLKAAGDADAKIRPVAIKRLGELAKPSELGALVDLLMAAKEPGEIDAAQQAVETVCGKADKPEANVQKLTALLVKADVAQKIALLKVLGVIGGADALKAVRAVVNDANGDARVRSTAIRTLGVWKSADAAPDLLSLAKTGGSENDKILGLRSYLGLAGRRELSSEQRLSMCKEAAGLVARIEEKRLLVATLGDIASVESLAAIMAYVSDAGIKEEACQAAVAAGAKLLQGAGGAQNASKVIEPMGKVAGATADTTLARRARQLQQQAQRKAGGQ